MQIRQSYLIYRSNEQFLSISHHNVKCHIRTVRA